MKTKWSTRKKWLLSIAAFVVLALTVVGGLAAYAVYDCVTTGCATTEDPEHEAEIREKAVGFAAEDCLKSYKSDSCRHLEVISADFTCGFMGFCGWITNIKSTDGNFAYRSGASLEASSQEGGVYKVTSYDELETPYAEKITKLFLQICNEYQPTRALGCDELHLGATIDWLGNRHEGNPAEGVSVSYLNPYEFKAKIDRNGRIIEAHISNFEDASDSILYSYDMHAR
jgi:hypothetical protein